ncbi:MAG: response regulator [Bdellovibrionota bacterium]
MSLHKLTVLIVDDNSSDRVIAKAMLVKLGIQNVQEAEDGKIAENKILTAVEIGKPFDVILVDWKMPRGDGIALLKIIRSHHKTKATKVILMTGMAEQNVVIEAKQSGVDDFLVKPLEFEQVELKIKKLLK